MISKGTALALLRKQNNMTQEEVAQKLGISRNILAAYESGKAKIPLSVFIYLSDLYNCDVFSVLGVYAPFIEYDIPETELIKAHARYRVRTEWQKDNAYGANNFPNRYYEDRYNTYIEEALRYYKSQKTE